MNRLKKSTLLLVHLIIHRKYDRKLKTYLFIHLNRFVLRPELILGEGYSFNSDVWSAGCVLYELISLEKAFKGGNQFLIIKSIIENDVPKLNDSIFDSVLSRYFICSTKN